MKITFPFSIFVIFFNYKNKLCPWRQTAPRGRAGPQDCKSWKAKVATECFHGNGYPASNRQARKQQVSCAMTTSIFLFTALAVLLIYFL
jgi:hypothetical protein